MSSAFISLKRLLEKQVKSWVETHFPGVTVEEYIRPCNDPRHGHFQSNIAMPLGKQAGRSPREIGQELMVFCAQLPYLKPPQVAGPGFVNFVFKEEAILKTIESLSQDSFFGIPQASHPKVCVVDYGAPNVAKSLHVGHLRSAVIGDAIYKLLKAVGNQVISDTHLGDWGTQFGIMLLGYKRAGRPLFDQDNGLEQMEAIYVRCYAECKQDEALFAQARAEVVRLQDGDVENNQIWRMFCEFSKKELEAIYVRMGVKFDAWLGESFYNPWLKEVVEELRKRGIAQEGEGGAIGVFFTDEEKEKWSIESPFLIQKSDGAALYATTDLATIRYRIKEWKAQQIVYVVDGRQRMHFAQLFCTARKWGYTDVELDHVWFGTVLGADKKPLKTREGTPIKLRDLLEEAIRRAQAVLQEKRSDLSEGAIRQTAEVIGIGALKYADLLQNRHLDYVFDWDRLLSFEGNTAPYLLNAYVRTRSILRKAAEPARDEQGGWIIAHEAESELMRKLIDFGDIVDLAAGELKPHHLCTYLYELASLFHRFFEHCPVLNAGSEELKQSRLRLCKLTGDVLARGLSLLGIGVVEQM